MTVKVEPTPGWLCTSILPPSFSIDSFTMANPKPVPPD